MSSLGIKNFSLQDTAVPLENFMISPLLHCFSLVSPSHLSARSHRTHAHRGEFFSTFHFEFDTQHTRSERTAGHHSTPEQPHTEHPHRASSPALHWCILLWLLAPKHWPCSVGGQARVCVRRMFGGVWRRREGEEEGRSGRSALGEVRAGWAVEWKGLVRERWREGFEWEWDAKS